LVNPLLKPLKCFFEAFGEHSLSRIVVFEWHLRFKDSRVSVGDDERSGRPGTSKMTENFETVQELIHEDHHGTIHELADIVGISYSVCQKILTENLNMHHISAKFVPGLLTDDQKQRRVNMS
jgi:hypothetical protein